MAPPQHDPYAPSQVAEKVMRRIEIAKVARNLQDCLAFASFKAQNGWQDRTLRSIEPEVAEHLKRKRPTFEEDLPSDDSEDILPSNSSAGSHLGRRPNTGTFKIPEKPYTTSRKRVRSASATAAEHELPSNWKHDNGLAQSSPTLGRTDSTDFDSASLPQHTIEDSPMFDVHSEEEDHETGLGHEPSSSIISSPPRTPPPAHRRLATSKQSGADLLLYLANSPSRSPAVNVAHISSSAKPPSTPPSQHTHLPSSVMNTPGNNLSLFNGALTPGQSFNLADFCNVTPSPGQAPWGGRTPGLAKTPSRLARPMDASRKMPTSQGLALQLGDELMPRS
ncbi:uncharacterized protein HMPREF1541_02239 [Cyphellophora europaea CBS 101466]|uniref:Uncharacterized protein n=1 Tax=Cyphellophora europaea (strain CBS 101466) TaxID=1220924 RepID=W2S2Z1_CYPE1|nr:uncharacterized protein HMPREF1541_02239 [Cyphellophora europaea CBS 101466]ETN43081.1 hypothetical protein HMPREF1541_02239 [Cyphellophora europaea CBS 101466]